MSQTANPPRSTWSNRWAFILVTIGSAVGLGNIWKFPYMAGSQGGSAFVLVYLLCVLLIGLPLLMAEILIGRRGKGNPVSAMVHVAEESRLSSAWALVGWIGVVGALLILSFYSVVAGWIVDYLFLSLSGLELADAATAARRFEALLASPGQMMLWHTVFLTLTVGVVARGVIAGIERANRIMMPGLFLILVLLTLWGGIAGDMQAAWHFMFDFRPEALTPAVILAAVGHAFFSLSLGMGAIMAYGSYLDRQSSIAGTSLWIAFAGTVVGLLAGLAIFSLTFSHGLEPASGPGLILQTLPLAFTHMPGGQLFAIFFFLLVLFAAWTSAISLVEPFVAWLTERLGLRRPLAAWSTGFGVWLLGLGVCLSFNHWSGYTLFGLNLFELLDFLTSRIMMPLSGLAIALFVGWSMTRARVMDEMQLPEAGFNLWYRVLRYLAPLGILLVFLHVLGWLG
ncbi:sodium-dependent transporter [Azovibrio restrictus]|uniref:sodium-dependent transporter n=1 Tax=Azovibrio restrictus TaxID=146938 RepID=UPI0026ED2981|nr:sodium-dependent transporter [Azovibrio restrictus]